MTHRLRSNLRLCALGHRPLRAERLYNFNHLKEEESGRESQVEITNTDAEKHQQPQLNLVEFQAAEGSFKQPTAAEISILNFWKLRDDGSHTQELSNEFAHLLNRGSWLE